MIKHVIVQAGGKGSRMGKLTYNKPKCLISVNGTTVLQTVATAFPDATLEIIGDYKIEVLQSYLEVVNPEFDYNIISATGNGTNSGIVDALNYIPNGIPFAISWSDLYYRSPISIPDENKSYVGLTNSNKCRYNFKEGEFKEEETTTNGVVGLFFFKEKNLLADLPKSGEFVRYLSSSKIEFVPLIVDSVYEIGTLDNYMSFKSQFPNSRFFNNVEIKDNVVIKRASNSKFEHLLADEINWYLYMNKMGYTAIPQVHTIQPLTLDRIRGSHPHQMNSLSKNDKVNLIENIVRSLNEMHSIDTYPVNLDDLFDIYVNKTMERIRPVAKMLKLNSNKRYIVNGKKMEVINPDDPEIIIDLFRHLSPISSFCPIHGDPTFSNTLVTNNNEIKFIDPRGYFGSLKIYGDPRYDFAKLYYSAIGNYDQFNEQNFEIKFNDNEVTVKIASSGFEDTWKKMKSHPLNFRDIEIIHSLIWLSLSGYFLNDVDSMMASYFHGLELVMEVINKYGI